MARAQESTDAASSAASEAVSVGPWSPPDAAAPVPGAADEPPARPKALPERPSQGAVLSAAATAWWMASWTALASANRTSSFCGWTLTSTRSSGSSTKRTPPGWRPGGRTPA